MREIGGLAGEGGGRSDTSRVDASARGRSRGSRDPDCAFVPSLADVEQAAKGVAVCFRVAAGGDGVRSLNQRRVLGLEYDADSRVCRREHQRAVLL